MFQFTLFLQTASPELDRTTESESILDLIFSGGAIGVVLVIVLLIMSVIALYIFI